MEIHLHIIGSLLIPLALLHLIFPRYFHWATELRPLSLINREMMYVHTFFVAFMVLLMGLLCLSSAKEIVHTAFGRRIALGMGIFWLARLLVQFWGYSPALWRGKKFETSVHLIFSLFWAYLCLVFFNIRYFE